MAEPNIRKYENGKQNPKLETIEKIASALGVTAFDLMGIEYFDLKSPDAGRQYAEYDGFQKYLQSMGFSIKEKQENEDSCSFVSRRIYTTSNFIRRSDFFVSLEKRKAKK